MVDLDLLSYYTQELQKFINKYKLSTLNANLDGENAVQEFYHLKDNIRTMVNDFLKRNNHQITKEQIKNFDEVLKEENRYLEMLSYEIESHISNHASIDDREVLQLQSKLLRDFSRYYLIQERINYFVKVSKQNREHLLNQAEYGVNDAMVNDFFIVCKDANDKEIPIMREFASEYQNLIHMQKDVGELYQKNLHKLEKYYERENAKLPVIFINNGKEIVCEKTRFDLLSKSEESLRGIIKLDFEVLEDLSKALGEKANYRFIYEGKQYNICLPKRYEGDLKYLLNELADIRDILQQRKNMGQNSKEASSVLKEEPSREDAILMNGGRETESTVYSCPLCTIENINDYTIHHDIDMDYNFLANKTPKEAITYLQSIMSKIESASYDNTVQVRDLVGNKKTIPVVYYSDYMDCKDLAYQKAMEIKLEEARRLPGPERKTIYEQLMQRIEMIKQPPMVTVQNKNISAKYTKYYLPILTELKKVEREITPALNDSRANQTNQSLVGYLIDEEYLNRLDDHLKLSYYGALIGKASECPMEPKVAYEVFGNKIQIPVALVTTVQECEKQMKIYMEKNALKINVAEVRARDKKGQFEYYRQLINKMRYSNKEPKVYVQAYNEVFEIPNECVDTFNTCMKEIENIINSVKAQSTELSTYVNRQTHNAQSTESSTYSNTQRLPGQSTELSTYNNSQPFNIQSKDLPAYINPKKHKVKKVRKPFKTKVKEFLKKISNRTKLAFMMTASFVSVYALGFLHGNLYQQSKANEQVESTILNEFAQANSNVADLTSSDLMNGDASKILGSIDSEMSSTKSKEDEKIEKLINAAKQSIASQFGSTFTLNGRNIYLDKDDKEPKQLKESFQKEVYTITSVVVEIPGAGREEINYQTPSGQAMVNELTKNGAKIVRVSGVAQKGEENYYEKGVATGYFDISDINMVDYANRSTTNLSQQILAQLSQGKGMGR